MKQLKTVKIYDYETARHTPPSDLAEYIAWLQAKLAEVPEEFRSTARTEIYATESYGSGMMYYTITYNRPETDEEEAARENVDRARAEVIRKRELATLEALRAKYQDNQPQP